ncbi:MAG: hypothetical protein LC620_01090, partial [Halobacteriales archaeon]|nr:hypothetical protein [Halobacteriales archaeon]
HAVYTLAGATDGAFPTEVEFQWQADGVSFDETGARVAVNQLTVGTHDAAQDRLETFMLVPGTTREAAWTTEQSWNSTVPGFFAVPGGNGTDEEHLQNWNFQGRTASLWCGIRNDLQGAHVDLAQDVPVTATCWDGPGSWNVEGYAMHATKVLQGGNARMVTFRVFYHDRGHTYDFMEWAFREDLPYPVNMTLPGGAGARYDLTAFAPGAQPILAETRTIASAPPPVVFAPRQPWGPDETGLRHPFPASAAFRQARDDPQWTGLRDFLAQHPKAYVGTAGYWEDTYDFVQRSWTMVVTDGSARFAFMVANNYLPTPSGLAPNSPMTSSYRTDVSWGKDEVYPTPADAPAQMPTVTSLMAGWAYLAQANVAEANEWKWDVGKSCHESRCSENSQALGASPTRPRASAACPS